MLGILLPGFLQEVYGDGTQDSLHHSKVLFTVMSLRREYVNLSLAMVIVKSIDTLFYFCTATYLEESRSKVVLNENAAYTPDITGMVPAKI